MAIAEQRRHTAHSHNEQGAGEAQWAVDPSSVPRISHDPENAHDGNSSYESLLVFHSVKKIIMPLRTLVLVKEHTIVSKKSPIFPLVSQAPFYLKCFIFQPGSVKPRYR